jgi:glucose repression regulatory protein TUP1
MPALPPNPSTSGSAAPKSDALVPPQSAGIADEFSFHNVPPEFKREGSDWFAAFNPKIKRQLDINLVHSFAHTSVVCCVQFSQDGRYLATGCNQTAQIFDTVTGQKVCELVHDSDAHTGDLYIRSVRFSPDGKLLATGAEDRKIRIWDIANRGIRNTYDGHQQEIYSLDFSLDGRLIVSGSGDRTTRIWDMQDNTCKVFTIVDVVDPSTDAGVTSVAISPRADLVAAGSLDNVIRIWDVASGHLVEMLRGHGNSVYSVAFTPDGKGLVTGSLDKTLKLWDVSHLGGRGGRPGGDRDRGGPPSRGGKVDPDRKVGGTIGGSPCVMDFIGHKDYVLSVSMSSDSRWVVSGSKDRCVHVWDSNTAVLQLMLQGHKNSVISLDLNSANDLLATGSGDSYARIWSLTKVA